MFLLLSIWFQNWINRFSGHFATANFIQNKWTSRWITIYKSSSSSSNTQQITNNNGKTILSHHHHRHYSSKQLADTKNDGAKSSNSTTSSSSSSSSSKKGKFSKLKKIRKSWNWKAGAGWTILSVLDWWLIAAGGWLTWSGLLLKWTPIGIGLATIVHWHLHNQKCDRMGQPRTASKWMVNRIFFFDFFWFFWWKI